MTTSLNGLFAATYTPFTADGSVKLGAIGDLTEHLIQQGCNGLFVCGSTGEGMSLTSNERQQVASAFLQAAGQRIPMIVHVGHNCLRDAGQLARHAEQIGADAIAACSPSYYKPSTVADLVDSMAYIASFAPSLPFYYYHIPSMTGLPFRMTEFLRHAADRIPNLAGLKYTEPTLDEFQRCVEFDGGRFHMMWGVDEMLLAALVAGAQAAVGSTYNIASVLYRQLIDQFQAGNLEAAKRKQFQAIEMIGTIQQVPFHAGMKTILHSIGIDCGACRSPLPQLSDTQTTRLLAELTKIGFYDWAVDLP